MTMVERERGRAATATDERTREDEEVTPVNMPVPRLVERINERTKASATTTDTIFRRVEGLERGLADARLEFTRDMGGMRTEVVALETRVVGLDGKVDVLVEEAQHTRREREEREKRHENRADAELKYRRERAFKIIAIVVPTLTALGALIAGIIAATRSPEIKYIPREPATLIERAP